MLRPFFMPCVFSNYIRFCYGRFVSWLAKGFLHIGLCLCFSMQRDSASNKQNTCDLD
jgi:hypothetical protein